MATPSDDAGLLQRFTATRNPALREEFILRYVSLVHFVLGRLGMSQQMGPEYEDMVSQGLLGLIEAVDRYDPAYGTQFSTYATVRIRGKILDYLRSLDWLSRTARHRARAVQTAVLSFWDTNKRAPTDDELSQNLGLEVDKVQQALVDSSRTMLSLDSLMEMDNDSDSSLYDMLPDEQQGHPSDLVDEEDLKTRLIKAMKQLPEREQLLLSLYYFEELTLKEIGAVFGISESRVCQLHARCMLSLKAMLNQTEGSASQNANLAGNVSGTEKGSSSSARRGYSETNQSGSTHRQT
jgi:RNA polymerase sigma factor for flagellar operon FliA